MKKRKLTRQELARQRELSILARLGGAGIVLGYEVFDEITGKKGEEQFPFASTDDHFPKLISF